MHTWADGPGYCVSQPQYPLTVGVVVAVATGLERGCKPLVHACSKAKRPLVVFLKKCICKLVLTGSGNVCGSIKRRRAGL